MTSEVTFLHAADLHLGAPVRGLRDASPDWAARLQAAIAEAYDRVIDAAIAHDVDFVILAGDAFDTSRPSYADYLRFFAGLDRLDAAGIATYLISGNHDPFTTWAADVDRLPESAHLLGAGGPEFALFSREGEPLCIIGGRSYYNQSWPDGDDIAAGISRAAAVEALAATDPRAAGSSPHTAAAADARAGDAPFLVGVIHTGLDIDTGKAPSDLQKLLASDVDYWACGHLHRRCVFPSEAAPRVVFPGCIQGRDIKETGERGCYLVKLATADSDAEAAAGGGTPTCGAADVATGAPTTGASAPAKPQVTLEFIPTSSVVLEQMRVDVSACQTLADIARLVQVRLFHENGKVFSDEMVVRVTLAGTTPLHSFLCRQEIIDDLRKHINNAYPSFYCDALDDRTEPPAAGTSGTASSLFPSIVADMAADHRAREDVMINHVQNEFVKRGIAVPSALSRQVSAFNDAAEALVLDLLRDDETEPDA